MTDEKTDWLPKLTSVDDPIAEDWWVYTASDGTPRTDHIRVGRPTQLENGTDWYCPLQMTPDGRSPRFIPILGVGPVDALLNAMNVVRKQYEDVEFEPRGGQPPAA
jgi:hypothetical protein